jgi:hypothetical protein
MRRTCVTPLLLLALAAPGVAQTQKALQIVPDDALGFLAIHDLRQFSDKVEALAKKVNAPAHVSLLELVQSQGMRKSLNEKGTAVLMALTAKKDEIRPALIWALPVSDYAGVLRELDVKGGADEIGEGSIGAPSSLLAGIGTKDPRDKDTPKIKILVARKGEFALLTTPDNRDALQRVLTASKNIAAMAEPAKAWLAEQDIFGLCTHHGIKIGLAMGLNTPAGGAGSSTPEQHAVMKATYADIEKNVKLIAFGGRIEKEGHSRLLTRVYFNPDGPYAKWIAQAESLGGELLGKFPQERYLLAAFARISPQTTFEGVARLVIGDLPKEKHTELTAAATRLIQRVSQIGVSVYVDSGAGKPSPAGKSRSPFTIAALAKVDDPSAVAKDTIQLVKKVTQAANAVGRTKTEVHVEEMRLGDKMAHLVRLKDENAKSAPHGRMLLTALDTQTLLVGFLPDDTDTHEFVKRFAGQRGQTLASNEHLRKTMALLPERQQVALYLNMQALTLLGFTPFRLAECPPLALAFGALPDGIEAQFVIPFDTLQAVFQALNAETKKPAEGK